MKCSKCGQPINDGDTKCNFCGEEIKVNNSANTNKTIIVLLSIIIVLLLGVIVLFITKPEFLNFNNSNNPQNNDNQNQSENNNQTENNNQKPDENNNQTETNNPKPTDNNIESLSITSQQVLELYDKIKVTTENVHEDLHKSTKVYNSGLTEDYKIFLTFLRFNDGYESCEDEGLTVNKTKFLEKYKELFGDSNVNKLKSGFSYENISNVKESGNNYIFYSDSCSGFGPTTVYKIVKAEKNTKNNEIYIYDNYLYQEDGEGAEKVPVYADSDRKVKLLDDIDKYYESLYKKKNEKGSVLESLFKNYKEYMKKDLPLYKHIFAKNADGNYYWVSSEKVNS